VSEEQKAGGEQNAKPARKPAARKSGARKAETKAEVQPLELHGLKPPVGAVKREKRKGQGQGSGNGRQGGRGHKGAHSRSGFSRTLGFEGGQMPLKRTVPKRGFTNIFRVEHAIINLKQLEALGEKEVTPELLLSRGLVKKLGAGLKILGNGEITIAVKVTAHAISEGAKQKIEAAGGSVTILPPAPPKEGPKAIGVKTKRKGAKRALLERKAARAEEKKKKAAPVKAEVTE
jgi:large subunit ribosomal protein L15